MPEHTSAIRRFTLLAPLLLGLLAFGCGGDETTSTDVDAAPPSASDFPSAEGKTLEDLAAEATDASEELVALPTVLAFERGENRFAFGFFDVSRNVIRDADIAIYAARPNGEALGPFPARASSLETEPAFASATTTSDPDAATYLYDTEVNLPTDGEWRMIAMVRDDDGSYSYTIIPSAVVGSRDTAVIPDVGDPAPKIHTPTAEDVGGDLSEIDTRQPPGTMHEIDYADVIGKEPIVLSLSTPALCSSRVCGPVVDILEQVKNERPDDAAYIHMEIYENNAPPDITKQVEAFNVQTEPWLFVIDEDGKISSRIEGAFNEAEVQAAIDGVAQ